MNIAGEINFFDGASRIRDAGISFPPTFFEVKVRTVTMLVTFLTVRYPCRGHIVIML